MLFGDWFLCHGSYGNTVSENPTVRMKDELLPRRDLLLARKLDGDVLALTMSESPGRLDDLIDSHNRSAIADGNLFHGRRFDLFHSAFENECRRSFRQIAACLRRHTSSLCDGCLSPMSATTPHLQKQHTAQRDQKKQ